MKLTSVYKSSGIVTQLFESLMKEVKSFMDYKDKLDFSGLKTIRHRKKYMPGEKTNDEPIKDAVQRFNVETIFGSLDMFLVI